MCCSRCAVSLLKYEKGRKAVEGIHAAVVYELEVMIRWVKEKEE